MENLQWIMLIFMLNGGNGAAIEEVRFATRHQCKAIAARIKSEGRTEIHAICFSQHGNE